MAGLSDADLSHFKSCTNYRELTSRAGSGSGSVQAHRFSCPEPAPGWSDPVCGIRSIGVCLSLWSRLSSLAWCVLECSCRAECSAIRLARAPQPFPGGLSAP
eukprot:6182-Alexandrium_andersonii.AAC.1